MGVRQYIGARYVPQFYENSLGTAEWQAGVAYEPLTIVTYNGNSFTSKKDVPANIGEPNTHPEYWASTGIYNAQIDEYREETAEAREAAETAITIAQNVNEKRILKNCRFIFIGDSYATGYNGTDGTVDSNGWPRQIKTMLNLQNDQYFASYAGGAGFSAQRPGGGYAAMLTALAPSVTDPNTIDYVICCGGHNDRESTLQDIKSGMRAFYNVAHTNFPNARVLIGMIAWDRRQDVQIAINNVLRIYIEGIRDSAPNLEYLNGVENSLYNTAAFIDNDNIHPTALGNKQIASNIIEAISTGYATATGSPAITKTPINGWEFGTYQGGFGCKFYDGMAQLDSVKFELTRGTPIQVDGNAGSTEVLELGGLPKAGNQSGLYALDHITILVRHTPTGGSPIFKYVNGYIGITNNKLRVGFYNLAPSGGGWETLNIDKITIYQFQYIFNIHT